MSRIKLFLFSVTLFLAFKAPVLADVQTVVSVPQQRVSTQPENRVDLANQKLELEVRKLENATVWWWWLVPLGGFLSGLVGSGVTLLVSRWTRVASVDQVTHQKRHEAYPQLVSATSGLALYFPKSRWDGSYSLDSSACRSAGRAMSDWYFEKGGLLMSRASRDAYFRLARALTRAANAEELSTPKFPDDSEAISKKSVDDYERELCLGELSDSQIEHWKFGPDRLIGDGSAAAIRFKDFVFLRKLSSELRTQLAEDIQGRRTPI